MRKLFLLAALFPALLSAQNVDNTQYVREYLRQHPTWTVGQAVTAAQDACNPDTAIPCMIVLDPSLAKYTTGTLPLECSQCFWLDFRSGAPYIPTGGTVNASTLKLTADTLQANCSKVYTDQDVRCYGADPTGVSDSSAAINAALATIAANDKNVCVLFPPGSYKVNSQIVLNFTLAAYTKNKCIRGKGAEIVSALTSAVPMFYIHPTNSDVRGLGIYGLRLEGGGAETSLLTVDGSGAGNAIYNLDIDDLTAQDTNGIALNVISVFESNITNAWLASLSGTVDTAYIQSGTGNNTSSLTIDNMTTRGGLNGLETDDSTGDVRIDNSTFLLAQDFGAKINCLAGGTVKNAHAEDNWLSAASQSAGDAGVFVGCTGTVQGGYFFNPGGGKQKYGVHAFATGTITVQGVSGQGLTHLVHADALTGPPAGTVILTGDAASDYDATAAPTILAMSGYASGSPSQSFVNSGTGNVHPFVQYSAPSQAALGALASLEIGHDPSSNYAAFFGYQWETDGSDFAFVGNAGDSLNNYLQVARGGKATVNQITVQTLYDTGLGARSTSPICPNGDASGAFTTAGCSAPSISGSAVAVHAACIKTLGPPVQIGSCSTQPATDGTCTCN